MTRTLTRLFMITCLLVSGRLLAQSNDIAGPLGIGLRACPDGGGITIKYYITPVINVEAQVNGSGGSFNDNGPSMTIGGLVAYNFLPNNPQWRFAVGVGAHTGTWRRYAEKKNSETSVFGFDAMVSVEYLLRTAPLGIAIDAKPSMNFISGVTIFPNNTFGLSFRYYLGSGWRASSRRNIPGDN